MGKLDCSFMNSHVTITYNEENPTAMARFSKFGKVFSGTPKVKQVYYLSLIPSNSLYPLGVIEPANKKKSNNDCNQSTVSIITRANTANWPTDILEPSRIWGT